MPKSKPLEVIPIKGERELWRLFTIKLKQQRKEVWQVLKPFIERYIK